MLAVPGGGMIGAVLSSMGVLSLAGPAGNPCQGKRSRAFNQMVRPSRRLSLVLYLLGSMSAIAPTTADGNCWGITPNSYGVIILAEGIKAIPKGAFQSCTSLTAIHGHTHRRQCL